MINSIPVSGMTNWGGFPLFFHFQGTIFKFETILNFQYCQCPSTQQNHSPIKVLSPLRINHSTSWNISSHWFEALRLDPSAEKKALVPGWDHLLFGQETGLVFSRLIQILKKLGRAQLLKLLLFSASQLVYARSQVKVASPVGGSSLFPCCPSDDDSHFANSSSEYQSFQHLPGYLAYHYSFWSYCQWESFLAFRRDG